MDATRLTATMMVASALLTSACGVKSAQVSDPALNGQRCSTTAIEDSFLVKWKKEVPQEYKDKILHPGSLVTKFNQYEKSEIEKSVLGPHMASVESAEHEFIIYTGENNNPSSAANTTAWGPVDVQVIDAWSLAQGKAGNDVVVAVIDSGTDITHDYLSSQIYTNVREIPSNGIDDDSNGYIDDIHGYNFYDKNNNPFDGAGHGTHVSGIIAGQPGPQSFVGIAPKAKILPLKFLSSNGSGSVGSAIAALRYSRNIGAKVINASWGGANCSSILKEEIASTTNSGVLFVGSAGNSGVDISNPYYAEWPAAFQLTGKITVGAMNTAQVLSKFSNYGVLVDVAAPGENILSTLPPEANMPDNQLGVLSGTSMATPFVSGIAAILYSIRPTASPTEVSDAITKTVSTGRYGVRTQGKVNAAAAVQYFITH